LSTPGSISKRYWTPPAMGCARSVTWSSLGDCPKAAASLAACGFSCGWPTAAMNSATYESEMLISSGGTLFAASDADASIAFFSAVSGSRPAAI